MAMDILDSTTAAAFAAAASQQAQCEALIAAWAGGDVTAKIYNDATLRCTVTLDPFTIDTVASPRTVVCGATNAHTNFSTGSATKVVFVSSGTDIFEVNVGTGGISFFGAIKELCAPDLSAVVFTSDAGLPTSLLPAWHVAAVNEWAQISGTTARSALKDFAGVAVRDDSNGVVVYDMAPGGHSGNYTDNSVQIISLHSDTPSWSTVLAASNTAGTNLGTGGGGSGADIVMASDGHPVPRHSYQDIIWVPEIDRFMFGGEAAGQNGEGSTVDHFGYNPNTNDWDAQGTWPNRPNYRAQAKAYDPVSGKRWAFFSTGSPNQSYEYDPTQPTPTWTIKTWTGGTDYTGTRGAYEWDPVRSQIFHLSGGGWFTQAAGYQAQVLNPATLVRTDITFNASSAWTDFQANSGKFISSALVYDENQDCFYFYNGNTGSPVLTGQGAKVYKIIPNGTSTWDMEILTVTGVTPADESNNSGCMTKFFFVPRWNTLILIVSGQSIYYLPVA